MITLRFNGGPWPSRWITLTARPIQTATARHAARAVLMDPDSPATAHAMTMIAGEAFPVETWRTRCVDPAERLRSLTPDLQLQVLRALCPGVEVLHGL